MIRRIALCLLCLSTMPAPAGPPMTAEAFDAYTRGKTLFYGQNGQSYGAERYFDGRRVQWSFLDGDCKDGHWFDEGPNICFVYDDNPVPQCWQFELGANGLIAEFQGIPDAPLELYEAQEGGEMECLGPKIGV